MSPAAEDEEGGEVTTSSFGVAWWCKGIEVAPLAGVVPRPTLVEREMTAFGKKNLVKHVCKGWQADRNATSAPSCMTIAMSHAAKFAI